MRSNYKPLGQYIQVVNIRNTDLKGEILLGVSIKKILIPSIANTIGTDMSTYKLIKRNQFAYGPVTSRNGDKISVAQLIEFDNAIVSQAYVVFEVIDTEELDPEYLMMWFRRPEFDRYARFKSHGSARETFDWDEMCETELPIPSIDKQREIVKEYNTIVNRITLNEQLNQKLEETAQSLYKNWFVDFEFPNENGKAYKSSGGKMVYNEEMDQEVPDNWVYDCFDSMELDVSDGNYSSKYPRSSEFVNEGIPFVRGTDFENRCINPHNLLYISELQHSKLLKGHTKEGDILLGTRGEIGKYSYVTSKFIDVNINAQLVRINGGLRYPTIWLGCLLNSREYKEELESCTTGSALQQLSRTNLSASKLLIPNLNVVNDFSERFGCILKYFLTKNEENHSLQSLASIILSKMSKAEPIQIEKVY